MARTKTMAKKASRGKKGKKASKGRNRKAAPAKGGVRK